MSRPFLEGRRDSIETLDRAIDAMTQGEHEAPLVPDEVGVDYARILVAYDGSEGAQHALAWAKRIATEHGSEVTAVHAYRRPTLGATAGFGWAPQIAELVEESERWSRQVVDDAAATLRDEGVSARAVSVEGSPTREIARMARERRAGLVIAGGRRRPTAERLFLGSTALGLLEHAPCSVLLTRAHPPPRRILAATDGSHVSYLAVAEALRIASEEDSLLLVEHVLEYPDEDAARIPEGLLRPVIERIRLPAAPPRVRYLMDVGNPATMLVLRSGEENVDLIVMGSHGKGAVERMLVGSVSRRVANEAHASVLVVKEASVP